MFRPVPGGAAQGVPEPVEPVKPTSDLAKPIVIFGKGTGNPAQEREPAL